jgi:multimeric flavodoxin WrbA
MKVLLINGSPRKGGTFNIVKQLNELLISREIESSLINISDYNIKTCTGCYNCVLRGVEYCPLKEDEVRLVWNMITQSKVEVVGSPVYSLGIPGAFKNFMDRIAYNCHRPAFFGKPMVIIVTTAGMGINSLISQMKWFSIMGFKITGSEGFLIYPERKDTPAKTVKDTKRKDRIIRLIEACKDNSVKEKPSFIKYLQFQALKLNSVFGKEVYKADHEYYKNKEYYFPARLNIIYKLYGKLFYKIGFKSLSVQFKND